MTDIVKRLRDGVARKASGHSALWDSIMSEAADEIERLQERVDMYAEGICKQQAEEIERLRKVARAADKWRTKLGLIDGTMKAWLELGDALAKLQEQNDDHQRKGYSGPMGQSL